MNLNMSLGAVVFYNQTCKKFKMMFSGRSSRNGHPPKCHTCLHVDTLPRSEESCCMTCGAFLEQYIRVQAALKAASSVSFINFYRSKHSVAPIYVVPATITEYKYRSQLRQATPYTAGW